MLESTIKARRDRKGQGSQLVLALLSLPMDDDASVMELGKTKGAALANGLVRNTTSMTCGMKASTFALLRSHTSI